MGRAALLGALVLGFVASESVRANDVPAKYRPAIRKGLDWLVRAQHRDGHWDAGSGQYPTAMTGLAGMALLAEGSTVAQGKYARNLRMARDWMMGRTQANGQVGDPRGDGSYMYGHGFGLLFLSSVYGEEQDNDKRKKLEEILTRAAQFTRDAQTRRGGWGYVSARDSGDFDEGSVTITQLQALRAARNAGIKVPPEAIKDAVKYLSDATGPDGGVSYTINGGPGRPALTAAGICCGFSAGEYNSPLVKKWLGFCQRNLPLGRAGRTGHDEYTQYYYGQAMYILGDESWDKLFPGAKGDDRLGWKRYREIMFPDIIAKQTGDGSFGGGGIGSVYSTSLYLTVLQLDKNCLPIYQR